MNSYRTVIINIIILIIPLLLFLIVAKLISIICTKILVHTPTDEEKEELKTKDLYHYTNDTNINKIDINKINRKKGKVSLKKSKTNSGANLFNGNKECIYFFIGDDFSSGKRKRINRSKQEENNRVKVNASNLNFDKIKIRKFDNVLLYEDNYEGVGEIERNLKENK